MSTNLVTGDVREDGHPAERLGPVPMERRKNARSSALARLRAADTPLTEKEFANEYRDHPADKRA